MTDVGAREARAAARREQTRAKILEAATAVIAERGYASTSVADLIDAAGIARGTFYLYFESRDAVFIDILDRFIEAVGDAMAPVPADHPQPIAAMQHNVQRVVELFASNAPLVRVLFRDAVGHSAEVDAKVGALMGLAHQRVRGALVRGAERGVLRQVNAPVVASLIVGAVKEVVQRWLDDPSSGGPAELVAALTDFGLYGLARA